jgi:hypothetical protein
VLVAGDHVVDRDGVHGGMMPATTTWTATPRDALRQDPSTA